MARYIRKTQPSCEAASYTVKKLVTTEKITQTLREKAAVFVVTFIVIPWNTGLSVLLLLTEFVESIEAPLHVAELELHTHHAAGAVVAVVWVGGTVVVRDHQVRLCHIPKNEEIIS